jgi:hypothetical protein
MAAADMATAGVASRRADMAATEATAVATAKTSVTAAATAAMTSAVLCPQGYSQEERERRDGYQATHTGTSRL